MTLDVEEAIKHKSPLVEWLIVQLKYKKFRLVFQPIVSLDLADTTSTHYHETLLRHISGRLHVNPFSILEQYSAVEFFDYSICSTVISALERYPNIILGCNISAKSAGMSNEWDSIMDRLGSNPSVASRLVFEITKTAPVLSTESALEFFYNMRALGCKIAIDDFGEGFNTLDFTHQLKPDIIKIGIGYLHRSRENHSGNLAFVHLINLCKSMAPCVVVKGVESMPDKMRALDAGAKWVQGFLYGRPSKLISDIKSECRVQQFIRF